MNGFLNINKPTGRTSSDVVVFVRKRLPKGTAVGHGGTLDPEASGVLPVCVGSATRLFDYIIDKQKTYVARLKLGVETDTQDATGQVVSVKPVTAGEAEVRATLPRFTGDILQTPPMYSALKRDGKRLYQLARKGESVALEPRACRVDGIEYLRSEDGDVHVLRVCCGKGVYIRTLCHDIGNALGCGGHMLTLERVSAGIFGIADALTPEQIDVLAAEGRLEEALIPLDAPLSHLPAVRVGERCRHAVLNGNPLRAHWLAAPAPAAEAVRVYLNDEFVGIGAPQPNGDVKFRAMLYRPGGEDMRIIYDESAFTGRRSVVALGMFDGVHIGHQALIRRAVALAGELDGQSVVCTFDRHPLSVLCPDKAPRALLTLDENLKKFERLGADWALVQAFTPEYGATEPAAFLKALVENLRAAAIVTGENYTFGAGGRGDAALIRRLAPELGYRAEIVPPVMDGDVMCSSTRIRQLLAAGETEHAERLLRIAEE